MKRVAMMLALGSAVVAWADNEGEVRSCEAAKASAKQHAGTCDEELKKLSGVDCHNAAQRASVRPGEVESACLHRLTASSDDAMKALLAAEGDAAAPAAAPPRSDALTCKAVDDTGAVLAEATSTGLAASCNAVLKPLMAAKCVDQAPGATLRYQILANTQGKDSKSSGLVVCPMKK